MNNKEQAIITYNTIGKLPTKYIQCSKCSKDVTAFGSNLDGKIKKYGTLENLLETFVCRSCTSEAKPKKVVTFTKRVTKKALKEEKKQQVIPMITGTKRTVILKDDPDFTGELTRSSGCVRPDIFLDNHKACDGCELYKVCQASCKNIRYYAGSLA